MTAFSPQYFKIMGPLFILLCAQLAESLLAGFALPDPGLPIFPHRDGPDVRYPIRFPSRAPFRQERPFHNPFHDRVVQPVLRFTFQDTSAARRPNRIPGIPTMNVHAETSTTTTAQGVPVPQGTTTFRPPTETTIESSFIRRGGIPLVCYYYGQATTRSSPMNYNIEDIPGDLCTHVNLAYVGIDVDNLDIKSLIPSYENNTEHYKEFSGLKNKFLILETMISIGGWDHGGGPFSFVASDQSRRETFANNVLRFLQENNLSGVDLDWRFPVKESRGGILDDRDNYVQLLRVFHNAIRTKGYTVTATVPITPFYLDEGFNVAEMVKYLDWFNVLGFDLRGRWNGKADVHSPLHRKSTDTGGLETLNIEDGLKRLEELGAPRNKLVVGIPFFGRSFVLANEIEHGLGAPITQAPAAPGPFIGSDEIQAYYEICVNVLDGIATREFDNEGKCPYAYYGDQWIGYEDEESVGIKMDFIIKEKYAGVMVFNNDMDDFRGVCGEYNPLLKAIYEKLASAP